MHGRTYTLTWHHSRPGTSQLADSGRVSEPAVVCTHHDATDDEASEAEQPHQPRAAATPAPAAAPPLLTLLRWPEDGTLGAY
eukprot:COSAG05_NODE_1897_length_3873_cov_28.019873_2_plen_82_part_00